MLAFESQVFFDCCSVLAACFYRGLQSWLVLHQYLRSQELPPCVSASHAGCDVVVLVAVCQPLQDMGPLGCSAKQKQ